MRRETVKKYVDRYSLGVADTENSLAQYNAFFRNMGFSDSIEQLIEDRLKGRVFVRVMDIGCGNAGFLSDLKEKFGEKVHTIGVDLLAPEKQPDQFVIGDALEAKFPGRMDFVFSFRSLHEIGEPGRIITKAYECLANGGKAFLSFRTMDLYTGSEGIAEIGEKEVRELEQAVRRRKIGDIQLKGHVVTVTDSHGKKLTAGVNIFLEKWVFLSSRPMQE